MKMYKDMFIDWLIDNGCYSDWSSNRNNESIFDCEMISSFYKETVHNIDESVNEMWIDYVMDILPIEVSDNMIFDDESKLSIDFNYNYDSNNNAYVRVANGKFIGSVAESMCCSDKHIFLDSTTGGTTKIAKLLNNTIRTKQELKLPKYLDKVFSVESLTNLIEGSKDEEKEEYKFKKTM